MKDIAAAMDLFLRKQAEYRATHTDTRAEEFARLVKTVESNTERLFSAEVMVEKPPYTCPLCLKECVYEMITMTPERTLYRRPMCDCEQADHDEETARRAGESSARRVEYLRSRSRLAGKLERMRFKGFWRTPGTEEMVAAGLSMVKGWPESRRGLVFGGKCGCGKTHIAAAIGNCLLDKGVSVEFWPVFELLQEIRRSYDRDGGDSDLWERLSLVKVLILDDLGNERIAEGAKGDWAREQLFRILYHRDIRELPVVVTTNLSADELTTRMGEPLVSRLIGMCTWISVDAPDHRQTGNL